MRFKRLFALLMAMGLVAAACGDSDEDTGGTDTTEGAATETTEAEGGEETETTGAEGGGEGEEGEEGAAAVDPADIEFDYGVTEDTIRVGMLADLSGIFAPLVTEIVEAQEVFWDKVNEEGGIAGRQIELVVADNGYDVPRQLELYEEFSQQSEEGVVIISQSTGSPHTSAIAPEVEADSIVTIPLSWYSGWADPDFGGLIAETYTNYCIESMNAVSWMADKVREETGEEPQMAIISFPGEYGQDGAAGAKLAAEALGIEIVYDGEAQVVPGADQTPIISELVNSGANLVYATINPTTLAEIFGGARAQGFEALWTGNSPTFNYQLLGTDLAADLDQYYWHSTYVANWGADVEGMDEVVEAMTAARPDAPTSDVYILGWTEAQVAKQILEDAAAAGDLTRAGVAEAFRNVEVDFGGLAPAQNWIGEPNDYIVRESYMYDVVAEDFNLIPLSEGVGSTGLVIAEGPFVSDVAADYVWDGPCFEPQG